jgi:thiosulfate reductase/polysulfide reductase chain A
MTKAFLVDLDRCINCYACEIACKDENDLAPGVRRIKVNAVDTGEFNRFYIPVFEMEKQGVGVCTLCPQLQAEGRKPACVQNCLTNALHFGDAVEIEAKAEGMTGEKLTTPHKRANVVYVSRKTLGDPVKKAVSGH